MKSLRIAATLATVTILVFSAGLLLGQDKEKKQYLSVDDIKKSASVKLLQQKNGPQCDAEQKDAFSHDKHLGLKEISNQCAQCHQYVSEKNQKPGEQIGQIRRPGHSTCIKCHSGAAEPKKPSFFEKDDAKRTICRNCHQDQMGQDGKAVVGSYNEMSLALKPMSYGLETQAPCKLDYGFDFSHKAHESKSCNYCHAPVRNCKEYKKDSSGKVILDDYGMPRECATPKDATAQDGEVMTVPGHAQCWACHQKDGDPAALAKASPDRCESCHKINVPAEQRGVLSYHKSNRKVADKFTHAKHMASLNKSIAKATPEARCEKCHKTQTKATTVADVKERMLADLDMEGLCFSCHQSEKSQCFFCHNEGSINMFDIPMTHR